MRGVGDAKPIKPGEQVSFRGGYGGFPLALSRSSA
jgi:hypothetical protein